MWARVTEVMLGCWLAISPLVFGRGSAPATLWAIDLSVASAVIVLALLSYLPALRYAHLFSIFVAGSLVAYVFIAVPYPTPPEHQNHVVTGLLVAMFALIPNHATHPPAPWRDFDPSRG